MLYLTKNGMPKRFRLMEWKGNGIGPSTLETVEKLPGIIAFCKKNDYPLKTVSLELPRDWPVPTLREIDGAEKLRFLTAAGLRTPKKRAEKSTDKKNAAKQLVMS